MKPNENDYVVILLQNSLKVEGKVTHWDKSAELLSSDNSTVIVILNVERDVILFKIIKPIENQEQVIKKQEIKLDELKSSFEEEKNKTVANINLNNLAQLRKAMIEEEKKSIALKIKTHSASQSGKVEYGLPGFFKKQDIK